MPTIFPEEGVFIFPQDGSESMIQVGPMHRMVGHSGNSFKVHPGKSLN